MFLSDIAIRRPVLAIVVNLLLVVFGVFSLMRMPAREYPNIDAPVVSVITVYRGASAQIVESQVTQQIEGAISGIAGIRTMRSNSDDGSSMITIEFATDRDIDDATNDVRDRVGRAMFLLPPDVQTPLISKVDADAEPFMWLSARSSTRSMMELTDYIDRYVFDQFASLPGVANIFVGGGRQYAMRIWLDRAEMAARGVTVADIEQALRRQNVDIPAGRIESTRREFTVRTETRLGTPEEFRNVVIARDGDVLVRLGEVARVEIGPQSARQGLRFDSENAVGIGIVRQSQSNALEVAQGVRAVMPKIIAALPPEITLVVSRDDTRFVETSLWEVNRALMVALVLVVAVIFVFIGTLRATLIPALTIPVAIMGAFIVLNWLGYSINVLTLLALALAIGLVVDDAIIVMENISRRIEKGEKPLLAALLGTRQIYFAVLATTAVLVAVLIPVALLQGNIGRLFSEFAVSVAAAVIFSGFVALTLTPMLCSRLLKANVGDGFIARANHTLNDALRRIYRRGVELTLKWPTIAFGIWLLVIPVCWALYQGLPKSLTPVEDRGEFSIVVNAPIGSSWDYLIEQVEQVERIIDSYRDRGLIRGVLTLLGNGLTGTGGVDSAVVVAKLVDWSERDMSSPALVAELRSKVAAIPGARIIPINRRSFSRNGSVAPLEFVISGYSYERLAEWRDVMFERLASSRILHNLRADYEETKPEFHVEIDRDRAAALGIDVDEIGRTIETMMGSRSVTRFAMEGEEYEVILQATDAERMTPTDLTNMFVRSPLSGELVSVGSLVYVSEQVGPTQLNRFNRLRAVTISAQIDEAFTLGQAMAEVEAAVHQWLPAEAQLSWDGEAREFAESTYAVYFAFGLAFVVVFLVLAAQFESFVHPIVILGTVPLGLIGALGAVMAMGMPVTIYTQIGLIMLIGLVAKNAILVVDFANQLRRAGADFETAILDAATTRLRPILMTSLATIMSAVPLALAVGAGSEARQAIGIIVVGGVLVGTFLSLFISPALYWVFCRHVSVGLEGAHELDALVSERQRPAE